MHSAIRITTIDRGDQFIEWTLCPSSDHDLFQFGRDRDNNDFYIPGHEMKYDGDTRFIPRPSLAKISSHVVSRLAFRVQCSRSNTKDVKIYAAGFDDANELFLGPYALRWGTKGEGGLLGAVDGVDGGITAGLHLWKPDSDKNGRHVKGEWYEISALGEVYHLRVNGRRGRRAEGVDNVLTEGCIIVNADSVLLFTTSPPSKDGNFLDPKTLASGLRRLKTLCAITLDTISFNSAIHSSALHRPVSAAPQPTTDDGALYSISGRRAGVFPKCGHVFELPQSPFNDRLQSCPNCRVPGRMLPLVIQTAPTFFPLQRGFAVHDVFTHVLPCGHAVSEELGKRMAGVALPTIELLKEVNDVHRWVHCLKGERRRCWFCGSGFNAHDLKKLYYGEEEGDESNEGEETKPDSASSQSIGNSTRKGKRKRRVGSPAKSDGRVKRGIRK